MHYWSDLDLSEWDVGQWRRGQDGQIHPVRLGERIAIDSRHRGPQPPAPFHIDLELRDGDLYIRPRARPREAAT